MFTRQLITAKFREIRDLEVLRAEYERYYKAQLEAQQAQKGGLQPLAEEAEDEQPKIEEEPPLEAKQEENQPGPEPSYVKMLPMVHPAINYYPLGGFFLDPPRFY